MLPRNNECRQRPGIGKVGGQVALRILALQSGGFDEGGVPALQPQWGLVQLQDLIWMLHGGLRVCACWC